MAINFKDALGVHADALDLRAQRTRILASNIANENTPGFDAAVHRPLTTQEKYLLVIAADLGGQYYSLENSPGEDGYGE